MSGDVQASLSGRIEEAVEAIRQRSTVAPRIGVILGTGLGSLAEDVTGGTAIPYNEIPHFPAVRSRGHAGELVLGHLEGQPVVVMGGRAHLYEGNSPERVVFPVRVMKQLGVGKLLITNAAGGINLEFRAGSLMLIADHINLTGQNPLAGPNDPELGPRFPDMTEAYSEELRALARRVAGERSIPLAEGVYVGVLGPSFETPAEIRMARALGADAVGMSTVMEVIAANHCGMSVLGISLISNMAAGILSQKLMEGEVFAAADEAREEFTSLVHGIIAAYEQVDAQS